MVMVNIWVYVFTLDYANVRILNDNVPRRLWCYSQYCE